MRRSFPWPLLVLSLGCAGQAAPPAGQASDPAALVAGALRPGIVVKGAAPVTFTISDRMAHHHVPGVSIAVVDSGRIVWARGYGVKETGGTDSVTAETLFQAASISKPVGATAMLRLVEEGKLDLDRPVNDFLTSWKVPDNKFTAKEKVTLRRIASHNAGLTVHGFPGYAAGDSIPSVVDVLDGRKPANTGPVRVDTLPGAIWRYSGGGTTVMQLAVMDVTGEPYAAVVKRLVLDPIGMTRSSYEQPLAAALRGQEAAGHKADGRLVPGRWHTYPEQGAAGLWTTPTDLLKWAMAITDARAGRSTAVLSQAMATQMLTVQKAPAGLGPMLEGSGRAFHFGHGGANEGFRCEVIYFPELGRGAAVMTNGDNGGTLAREILLAIAAQYQWPEYGPREITALSVDSTALDRFVGTYSGTVPFPATFQVTREGSRLFVTADGIMPKEEIVFSDSLKVTGLTSGNDLTFSVAKGGKIEAIGIATYRFSRKEP
ncbi:MAG: serine hydrolase [Gemmatimonadetes bacterium]|nr:serine hydrolase [Gemmatimonadota bacterium]